MGTQVSQHRNTAMADDSVVVNDDDESKIVTKFLLYSCRLQQPIKHRVVAAAMCGAGATIVERNSSHDDVLGRKCVNDKVHHIPLITGSSAEFYIQPMLSFVGDVDIMCHRSDILAIPDGYPPPTELPAEFHSRAEVCEVIDSGYPG